MSPPQIVTRDYTEGDRTFILSTGAKAGVIDSPENRILMLRYQGVDAYVVWSFPGLFRHDIPTLGQIFIDSPTAQPLMYDALLYGACLAAMSAGHTTGDAFLNNAALLALMQSRFKISTEVLGYEDGVPGSWRIEFDLATNRAILEASLNA